MRWSHRCLIVCCRYDHTLIGGPSLRWLHLFARGSTEDNYHCMTSEIHHSNPSTWKKTRRLARLSTEIPEVTPTAPADDDIAQTSAEQDDKDNINDLPEAIPKLTRGRAYGYRQQRSRLAKRFWKICRRPEHENILNIRLLLLIRINTENYL